MRKRKNHISIWEKFHNKRKPKGMHIHHADGNPYNNEPNNLLLCTPQEHLELHKKLGHIICENFIKNPDWFNNSPKEKQDNFRIKKSGEGKRRYENKSEHIKTSEAGLKRFKDPLQIDRQRANLKNLWKQDDFRKMMMSRRDKDIYAKSHGGLPFLVWRTVKIGSNQYVKGEFLLESVNISEVCRQYELPPRNVSACLKIKRKQTKGFIFEYKEIK